MTGDELAELLARGEVAVVDVRSPEEYAGTSGYSCDPRQGHIDGAVNVELADIADAGERVTALLSARGIDPAARIVCYCHSGSRSAHAAAILATAGLNAENYEGSWHEWSQRAP